MSKFFNVFGKIISSLAKGYTKNTAKKRDKDDAKIAAKEQKEKTSNG